MAQIQPSAVSADPNANRAVGIGVRIVQLSVVVSYTSTVATAPLASCPPTA